MELEAKDKLLATLTPRQQTLDFACSQRWQELPGDDQHACRQLLTRMLCQVISQTPMEEDDDA
jgi:hypothetical protein